MIRQGNWEVRLKGCGSQLLQNLQRNHRKAVGVNRFRVSTTRGIFVVNINDQEVISHMRCCSINDAHESARAIAATLNHGGVFSTKSL